VPLHERFHGACSALHIAECAYTGLRDSVLTSAFHTGMTTGVDIPELRKGRDGKCCAPPGAQSLIPIPSISKQMTRLDPLALTRDSSVDVVERKVEGQLGEHNSTGVYSNNCIVIIFCLHIFS
jgi:hypothetical protein